MTTVGTGNLLVCFVPSLQFLDPPQISTRTFSVGQETERWKSRKDTGRETFPRNMFYCLGMSQVCDQSRSRVKRCCVCTATVQISGHTKDTAIGSLDNNLLLKKTIELFISITNKWDLPMKFTTNLSVLKVVPSSEEAGFLKPSQPPLQLPPCCRPDTVWIRQWCRSTDNLIQHAI